MSDEARLAEGLAWPGREGGDGTAFERRLETSKLGDYLDRLYRAAWALCASREDAEDLVQETYARVLARPRFLRRQDDLPYLLRALHNLYLTNARAKSGRHATTSLVDIIDPQEERNSLKPEAAFESREIYLAMASLPEALRAVLVAVDVAGLSYREAARALRVPEGTVMSRLYRARQQVGRKLKP